MPSIKIIKRRLASVTTTKKIMKAMNMVATAKMQKDRSRLDAARPFFEQAGNMVFYLKDNELVEENVFLKPRKVRSTAYLIITSDRGLCGSYNYNLSEIALTHMNEGRNEKIIAVGLKGYEYFKRMGKNILQKYEDIQETAFFDDAEAIGRYLSELYTSQEVDEVYVAYTRFESPITHVPCVKKLLPIYPSPKEDARFSGMEYDPNPAVFLDHAVPMYLSAFIYAAMLESSTCEQAARMVSMDTAVNNASDIIAKLSRAYNRRRQAAITQEISERSDSV